MSGDVFKDHELAAISRWLHLMVRGLELAAADHPQTPVVIGFLKERKQEIDDTLTSPEGSEVVQ